MLESPQTPREPAIDPENHLRSIVFGGGKQAYFERVAHDPKWVGASHEDIAHEAIKQAKQDAEGRGEPLDGVNEDIAAIQLLRAVAKKNGHEAQ